MAKTQLDREDDVNGEQYLYEDDDTRKVVGHYNSEIRTKIVASIEVVHGHTR